MGFKELFENAGIIAKGTEFLVRVYENKDIYTEKSLTYMELGLYLVSNNTEIKRVDIKL